MDELDRTVIACLVTDARSTYAEVGAEVGLSAPAVKRRVDRLLSSGVIRGFTAVVDAEALGWTTEAYVELYCKGTVAPSELRSALEKIPEVVGLCTVSGEADALVHVLARDIPHLENAIERMRADKRVDRTKSTIVLSRLVDRGRGS